MDYMNILLWLFDMRCNYASIMQTLWSNTNNSVITRWIKVYVRSNAVFIVLSDLILVFRNILESFLLFCYFIIFLVLLSPSQCFLEDLSPSFVGSVVINLLTFVRPGAKVQGLVSVLLVVKTEDNI
jgi:hypothetical protein